MDDALQDPAGSNGTNLPAASPCVPPMHTFTLVFSILICALGLPGNSLVIHMTRRAWRTSVNTVWFLCLAVADLTFVSLIPFSIAYLALGHHWPFGRFLCKLSSSLSVLTLFASSFTVALISLDRCLSVLRPVWSQNHRRPGLACQASLLAWLVAAILSVPTWIYRDTDTEGDKVICFLNFFHGSELTLLNEALQNNTFDYAMYDEIIPVVSGRMNGVVVAQVVLGFLIPFLVIAASYVLIGIQLRAHRRPRHSKPFRVMACVVSAFVICLLPLQVLKLLEAARPWDQEPPDVHSLVMPLASALAHFNSCLNPVLYFCMGQRLSLGHEVKRALRSVLVEESETGQTYGRRDSRSTSLARETSVSV